MVKTLKIYIWKRSIFLMQIISNFSKTWHCWQRGKPQNKATRELKHLQFIMWNILHFFIVQFCQPFYPKTATSRTHHHNITSQFYHQEQSSFWCGLRKLAFAVLTMLAVAELLFKLARSSYVLWQNCSYRYVVNMYVYNVSMHSKHTCIILRAYVSSKRYFM